jgi:hypothetical protein
VEMNADAAIEFAEFARSVLVVVQEFENKRAGYFEKYGEPVDEEGNWKIKDENEKKFHAAIKRSLNKEVDIDPINISESGIKVSPADVINILSLIK